MHLINPWALIILLFYFVQTPNHPHKQATSSSKLQIYTTTMILPELGESVGPLQISNFRTDMVDTIQQVGDIGSKVFFERISLNSNTDSNIKTEVNYSIKPLIRMYND